MSEQTAIAPAFMNGLEGLDEVISIRMRELKESALASMPTWRKTFSLPKFSIAKERASIFEMDCMVKNCSLSPVSISEESMPWQLREKSSADISESSGI